MSDRQLRSRQMLAWLLVSVFILGFFFPGVGMWTGPILGLWFVGTQKLLRGFLWMVALNLLPGLVTHWRNFPLTGVHEAFVFVTGILLVTVLGVLPFAFHRLTSPRLPGLLSTLPFPLASLAIASLAILPSLDRIVSESGVRTFLVCWFAAVVVWMWRRERSAAKVAVGAGLIFAIYLGVARLGLVLPVSLASVLAATVWGWLGLAGCVVLSVWALFRAGEKHRSWAERKQAVALLQSPYTGEALHFAIEQGREALVGASGERFPIRGGIPDFIRPEDVIGSNRKYKHLYETIGGFYDDTQRVGCALTGMDRDAYVMSYLGLLEIKPGDRVLETSVGTGLNFKYLPTDIYRYGLDLSPEMLANCEANLERWQMEGDLFLGNAECLPFADSSFDVVFHVGGINFFNDRGKAIREMIRVAKPGSLLLIADETEKHVKSAYENIPYTSSFFKGRTEAVTAPIDLVPAEMEEIRLESIFNERFYVLTFRKPAAE